MSERHQLIAYLATLAALVVVFVGALVTASISPTLIGKFETFGLGTITGGLIGVLRIPSSRNAVTNIGQADTVNGAASAVGPKGTPDDPVSVEPAP